MNNKLRIGLMLLIVALIAVPEASAVPSHLTNFTIKYPFTVGTRIDSCDLCHIPPFPSIANRNQFGFDFGNQTLHFTNPNQSFANIELIDSDGDTFTNLVEINALTFPGNQSDHPSVLDTIPPAVTITSPLNGSTVITSTITVSGTATDNVGVTNVTVNGIPVTIIPGATVTFSTTITPVNGTNTITVVAGDAAGNSGTATVTVTFTPPVGLAVFDLNGNHLIDRPEAVAAVVRFFQNDPAVTRPIAVQVVVAFFGRTLV